MISSVTYIVLCFIFILGLVGLFNKALEGTNYIIVGIFMIGICSKAHHSGGGGEYMYMRGWIGAIISLIYGIFKDIKYDINGLIFIQSLLLYPTLKIIIL